jgi:2-keto-4-pentenoate hydratase
VSLRPCEVQRVAERMLADYDAHRPNTLFAERGTEWLTLDDAYAVQHAVAARRRARGERCLGYKIGCVSPAIQHQLGLRQPVWGYLWESEAHPSGCSLASTRFANLAVEGEIALRLSRDIAADLAGDADLSPYIACGFPVIELHNHLFRGPAPTSQELVAGNAMHAGFVAPPSPDNQAIARLIQAEIRVELNGDPVETGKAAALPGGPLASLRWLASSLAATKERLKAGHVILTGSPGRLIPASAGCAITVTCEGQAVELCVEPGGA